MAGDTGNGDQGRPRRLHQHISFAPKLSAAVQCNSDTRVRFFFNKKLLRPLYRALNVHRVHAHQPGLVTSQSRTYKPSHTTTHTRAWSAQVFLIYCDVLCCAV